METVKTDRQRIDEFFKAATRRYYWQRAKECMYIAFILAWIYMALWLAESSKVVS